MEPTPWRVASSPWIALSPICRRSQAPLLQRPFALRPPTLQTCSDSNHHSLRDNLQTSTSSQQTANSSPRFFAEPPSNNLHSQNGARLAFRIKRLSHALPLHHTPL